MPDCRKSTPFQAAQIGGGVHDGMHVDDRIFVGEELRRHPKQAGLEGRGHVDGNDTVQRCVIRQAAELLDSFLKMEAQIGHRVVVTL